MAVVYVVLKVGVYRHEICGVYTDWELAGKRVDELASAEEDDYHKFIAYECLLNIEIDDGKAVMQGERKCNTSEISSSNLVQVDSSQL